MLFHFFRHLTSISHDISTPIITDETYGLHLRFTRRAGTHLSRTTINVNGTVERKTNVKPCEVQSSKADKAENVSHSAHPAHTPRVRSSPMVASALSKR
jgi:hypothetical protein